MKDRTRNIIVGLTILSALGVCMYGIVLLGKLPGSISQYVVAVVATDAAGITGGSKVELNGIVVGQSRAPHLSRDANNKLVVQIDLLIDSGIDIPSATAVTLNKPSTGVGQSSVQLKIQDETSKPIPKDGTAILQATVGDSGLIPQPLVDAVQNAVKNQLGPAADKIGTAAAELSVVAKDLHVLLTYTTPEAIEAGNPNDPNHPVANASTVIIRLDRTVKSLQELLTDPNIQSQLRQTVKNVADASSQLKTILDKVEISVGGIDTTLANANKTLDTFSGAATQATTSLASAQKDITRTTDKLVETLGQLDKSIRAITEGKGTTGRFINDPRLYESLNDLSKSLKDTVEHLDFLIKKWTDEGLPLHLK